MRWLAYAPAAVVAAALLACGASANSPDDGTHKDGGVIPLYDAGSDYVADAGGTACDTNSVTSCGTCGNVCPGLDASFDNVTCGTDDAGAQACTFSCQGEHYDVDQNATTGCEVADVPVQNHTVATAIGLGTVSCHDDSSAQNLSGMMPSDDRVHEGPAITGFASGSGSAPDYWTIIGSGGTCDDDINLTLTVTGSSMPTCYTLTVTTSSGHGPYNCTVGSGGSCAISNGSGSYDDGDTIDWYVTRTCSASSPESVSYTITGHL